MSGTTYQDWKEALDSQAACNASGLITTLAGGLKERIWEDVRREGLGFAQHPIVVLYVTQLGHLTELCPLADVDIYGRAYTRAKDIAEGLEPAPCEGGSCAPKEYGG